MRTIALRLPYLVLGMVLTYLAIVLTAGPPSQILSVHEIDGVAVRGGKIELLFDVRRTRACPSHVDRQLWRWDTVNGAKVQRIIPLSSVSTPISADPGSQVLLTLDVPAAVSPGEWFYASRTYYACSWLGWLGESTPARSPDVPVLITAGESP